MPWYIHFFSASSPFQEGKNGQRELSLTVDRRLMRIKEASEWYSWKFYPRSHYGWNQGGVVTDYSDIINNGGQQSAADTHVWSRNSFYSQSPSKLSVQLCVQVQSFIMKVGRGKIAAVSSAHIILGILMAVCGGLQIKLQLKFLWLDSLYAGIWVGIWVSHTHQY